MKRSRSAKSRFAFALAMALTGSTLFGGCPTRFKEAAVSGIKDYFLNDFMGSMFGGETYSPSYSMFEGL